ncbi:hypothetical protein GCM10010251_43140 [Streptomyces aurantiogriseus]|uniref:Uncharacterized protein n=1 Tax=Streptomyces aurantiogriseus TaxID=66870 RepID=A0A918F9N4_9ACTN|nr:hypothetical protein GCM10010251_43140 [Streptomyces aurantiogriseus]
MRNSVTTGATRCRRPSGLSSARPLAIGGSGGVFIPTLLGPLFHLLAAIAMEFRDVVSADNRPAAHTSMMASGESATTVALAMGGSRTLTEVHICKSVAAHGAAYPPMVYSTATKVLVPGARTRPTS